MCLLFCDNKNYLNICFIYNLDTKHIFVVDCKWGHWVDPGCPEATCDSTTKTLTRSVEQQGQCDGLECVPAESSKDESCPVLANGMEKIFISKFKLNADSCRMGLYYIQEHLGRANS
jgi:hypothetical protein